jgi:hypothetical protein
MLVLGLFGTCIAAIAVKPTTSTAAVNTVQIVARSQELLVAAGVLGRIVGSRSGCTVSIVNTTSGVRDAAAAGLTLTLTIDKALGAEAYAATFDGVYVARSTAFAWKRLSTILLDLTELLSNCSIPFLDQAHPCEPITFPNMELRAPTQFFHFFWSQSDSRHKRRGSDGCHLWGRSVPPRGTVQPRRIHTAASQSEDGAAAAAAAAAATAAAAHR